ncbi:MAG: hypothetical protein ACR2NL_03200 [Acidimicrobiia bacterium]
MEEYAARFADLLEQVATKVRTMTVDRITKAIHLGGLGILVATLAFAAVAFLIYAIFGALEIPLTTAGAWAVFATVLVGAGTYMWLQRIKNNQEE